MMLGMEQTVYQGQVSLNGSYRSVIPVAPLHHWISCFWQLDVEQGSYVYRSVPDNSVDWIINLLNPDECFIVSPFTIPIEFPLNGPVSYFGIRFRILGYQGLTQLPLGEWNCAAGSIMAQEIISSELLDKIQNAAYHASHFNQRCHTISPLLLAALDYPVIDPRLMHFLRLVNSERWLATEFGHLKQIEFGSSHRQLRRLSQLHLGLSMKHFSRVARFQKVLHRMHMDRADSGIWLDYFFDQSHFIREFKYFTGTTPANFRKMSFLYNQ